MVVKLFLSISLSDGGTIWHTVAFSFSEGSCVANCSHVFSRLSVVEKLFLSFYNMVHSWHTVAISFSGGPWFANCCHLCCMLHVMVVKLFLSFCQIVYGRQTVSTSLSDGSWLTLRCHFLFRRTMVGGLFPSLRWLMVDKRFCLCRTVTVVNSFSGSPWLENSYYLYQSQLCVEYNYAAH